MKMVTQRRRRTASAGAVWAYNCGASDGTESSAKFTFYPHAAGWSTMSPDDVETADNVGAIRRVDALRGRTLRRGAASAGVVPGGGSFARRADERGSVRIRAATASFSAPSLAQFEPSRAGSSPPHSRSCSSSSSVDDRRSSAARDRVGHHRFPRFVRRRTLEGGRGARGTRRAARRQEGTLGRVRQVAMEVHDAERSAKELRDDQGAPPGPGARGFEPDRVVVEQPAGLEKHAVEPLRPEMTVLCRRRVAEASRGVAASE